MPDQVPAQAPAPNQPATPLPAAVPPLPSAPERRPISTAATRLDPNQPGGVPAEKPKPVQGPDGKFISPTSQPPVQTPPAPVTAPAKPARPAWLDQVAANLGFTKEEIDRSDADSLGNAVALAQWHRSAPQQQPAPQAPAPPPAEVKVDLGLTPEQEEEFGPEMLAVLTKIAKDSAKKNQELEARLGQYEQREQARTRGQLISTLDTAINGLGKDYATVMGDGDAGHIMQNNPAAHRRRIFVLTTLENKGLNFLTASAATIQEAIRAQIEEDFPGMVKPAAPTTNPPAVTRDQWDRGGSPAPTQRRGSNEPPPLEAGGRDQGPITEDDVADERILAMLRKRKRGMPV